jgi:DNA modification methylase
VLMTDPPYGVGYEYNSHNDDMTAEAYQSFVGAVWAEGCAVSERQILTPGCYNLELWCRTSTPTHIGAWTKLNAMSPGRCTHFWTWEPIFFYGKFQRRRGNDVFNFPVGKQPDTGHHTCPKPIALWVDLVENFTDPNSIVLDLFTGSGTTLIACEKTGRRCYGMEIDPAYCQVILERWSKFSGKQWTKASLTSAITSP